MPSKLLYLMAALLVTLVAAPRADAQCVQTGSTVSCSGTDANGFAATQNGLHVTVESGATVLDGGAAAAISTLANSEIDVFALSDVTAAGDGAVGIASGTGNIVANEGTISATGNGGIGVSLSHLGELRNEFVTSNMSGTINGGPGGLAIRGDNGANSVENFAGAAINGDVALGGGEDTFIARTASIMNGTIDGGAGTDRIVLVGGGSFTGLFDLDTVSNFEELEVSILDSRISWTLEGTGAFANGARLTSGDVLFAPGTILGGPFTVEAGTAHFLHPSTFTDGVFIDGGTGSFRDGADVTGAVTVNGGAASFVGNATLNDGLTLTDGVVLLRDGANVTTPAIVADGGLLYTNGDARIVGDLTQNAGSVFEAEIAGDGTSTLLRVTGDISLNDAELQIRRSGTADIDTQQAFVILTGASLTGTFSDVSGVGPGTGFLALATGQNSVGLWVKAARVFTTPARSANQRAVGNHLDLVQAAAPSPELQSYLSTLGMLDTTGAVQALDALGPEVLDAHTSASLATANGFARVLAGRPIRCERMIAPNAGTAPSLSPCSRDGWTGWVTAFGRYANRDGRPGYKDWSYGGGGFAIGADHDLGDAFSVSALLGASRMALDYDGDGDGSATSLDLGVALGWKHEATYLRGVALYGHGWHDSRREVKYTGFSSLNVSDFGSDRLTLLVEGGHEFRVGQFGIEPLASVEYTYLHEDSAKESKSSIAALSIDSRTNAYIAAEGGVRVGATVIKHGYATDVLEWADGVWRPQLSARWRQVLSDYDRATSARLRAAPTSVQKFRTQSQDAQYGGVLGAEVSFQPNGTRNTIHFGYDAFVGNRTLVHTVMAKFRVPF